jgi:hypothetical protein
MPQCLAETNSRAPTATMSSRPRSALSCCALSAMVCPVWLTRSSRCMDRTVSASSMQTLSSRAWALLFLLTTPSAAAPAPRFLLLPLLPADEEPPVPQMRAAAESRQPPTREGSPLPSLSSYWFHSARSSATRSACTSPHLVHTTSPEW